MSWKDWFRGRSAAQPQAAAGSPAVVPRRPRQGGEAYAREWVKVLNDNAPDRDAASTYTSELGSDAGPTPLREAPVARPPRSAVPSDPYDSFTWETPETNSPDDPWGLKKGSATQKAAERKGANPYDTGVFNASWSGRFDQR